MVRRVEPWNVWNGLRYFSKILNGHKLETAEAGLLSLALLLVHVTIAILLPSPRFQIGTLQLAGFDE